VNIIVKHTTFLRLNKSFSIFLFFIFLFSIKSFSQTPVIQTGHSGGILSVCFINQNEFITGGEDGKLIVWDILTGRQKLSLQAHSSTIEEIKFKNNTIFTSSSGDNLIKVWDLNFNLLNKIGPFSTGINSFDVLENLNEIYIGGDYLYRYKNEIKKLDTLRIISSNQFESVHAYKNKVLVGGGYDEHSFLIDANELKQIGLFKQITSAGFSTNNNVYLGGKYGNLRCFDLVSKTSKSLSLQSSFTKINKIAVIDDVLIIADDEGNLHVRNEANFKSIYTSKIHNGSVESFAVSPDQNLIVTVGNDGKIFLRELKSGWLLQSFISTCAPITSFKSFDEGSYAVVYDDGSMRVWNVITNTVFSKKLSPTALMQKNNWHFLIDEIVSVDHLKMKINFFKVKSAENNYNQAVKVEKWQAEWDYMSQELVISKLNQRVQNNPKGTNWKTHLLEAKISSKRKQLASILPESSKKVHHQSTDYCIDDRLGVLSVATEEGFIDFYNLETKEFICSSVLLGYNDFLYINSENYYFTSKGALNFVGFLAENKMVGFQQFDLYFNRPDFVLSKLPFVSNEFVEQLSKAVAKRHLKLKESSKEIPTLDKLPQIKLHLPEERKSLSPIYSFKLEASSNNQLSQLNILINGVPENEFGGSVLTGTTFNDSVSIQLNNGLNTIEVYVEDVLGFRSLLLSFDVEGVFKTRAPELYIATIGVSLYKQAEYNLRYAEKDAVDLNKLFVKNKSFKKTNSLMLLNEEVTIESLQKIKTFFASAQQQDVIILFIAGHGVLDANFNYYIASHDMDFYAPEKRGIPYSKISEIYNNVQSRNKVILLDACHSGELDTTETVVSNNIDDTAENEDVEFRAAGINVKNSKSGKSALDLSKMLFADVSDSDGSTVISSASGTEYAMESSKWSNGLFTYCCIEGLKTKKADLNQDKKITVSELRRYVNNRVQELSNGKQNPSSRVENVKNDFVIF
jgi:WD40 repeat protein